MEQDFLRVLAPMPRTIRRLSGRFDANEPDTVRFVGEEADVRPALERVKAALSPAWRMEVGPVREAAVCFRLVTQVNGPQSYRLHIDGGRILAEAQDRAGLFYAAVTLAQLMQLSGGTIPAADIEDVPDFPVRGVLLDISRDKVPTMEALFRLTDRLADLKLNQLQLYTEHTFAYRGHEEVWKSASPMTPDDVRALDAYCQKHCVELVPNQNSFGHLERWLTLPAYNGLAELPQGGAPLPWGGVREKPTTLCPTDPRCVSFLAGLYDDLLPNFTSKLFNVGCDETFDLRGEGRSAARVKQEGEGRVYLDFLKQIHGLVSKRGRTMAFWGDIIIHHPELIPELPKNGVALEWGYEADHPFDAHGALFAASKIPFYVCPGTSSWNSLAGRTRNMRENLRSAAENGRKHGACGFLITDWGDGGHWQPLSVSYAGFTYGAGVSWCFEQNRDMDVAAAIDAHWAAGFGSALLGLGDVYRSCGALRGNVSELFCLLSKPRAQVSLPAGITAETLQAVLKAVEGWAQSVSRVSAIGAEERTVASEVAQVIKLLRASCHRGLAFLDGSIDKPECRRTLGREMDALMDSHARVWRLRNRTGGLDDSLAAMARIRDEYRAVS
jgi:hypothetical protein